jgi:predicted dehydrogenase/threonine dehydrogenase-like Zn-dependent dehydrogenase
MLRTQHNKKYGRLGHRGFNPAPARMVTCQLCHRRACRFRVIWQPAIDDVESSAIPATNVCGDPGMKQVLRQARLGEIAVIDVPAPKLLPGCVLVRMAASLVSAGTERASCEFASKNLLQKAKARPDLVREVVGKIRRDGMFSAVAAIRGRLDQPSALGYSSSGTVIEVGEGVGDLSVGDRVACAGASYAVHAEFACVPRLLAAKLRPDSAVSFEEAAFTTLGAVALHGVRTADVKLGDVVAVIGLGLLGQLTVQILKAAGCRVLGMDIAPERADLALRLGADEVCISRDGLQDLCLQNSNGHGADAVLITAETASSEPVNLAGEIARDRGVVVPVGTVGMDIQRKLYFEKELDFRISRSYGPGRYDSAYEQKGRDYPVGYVRWTETRNMEAFLQLLSDGKLDVKSLITHRFPIEHAQGAYDLIMRKVGHPFLGVLITYPEQAEVVHEIRLVGKGTVGARPSEKSMAVGVLGAGSFAMSTLLPVLKQVRGVDLAGVCAANGSHSRHAAEKFGFRYCATEEERILNHPDINTVVIATRHHLHAPQVLAGLEAGKHVFCEKPLCLNESELEEIVRAYMSRVSSRSPLLMVGFNRRFAPMAIKMRAFLKQVREPLALHYRVNAGFISRDHWVNDPEQGGGRILGEVCHFVDFLSFLAGALPTEVQAHGVNGIESCFDDNVVISLRFANGSQGTISYLVNGDRSYSKERVEVFGGGAVAVLEDFRRLELVRHGRKKTLHSRFRQDKGHRAELEAFAAAVCGRRETPIPFDEIVSTTLATLRVLESRSSGLPVNVDAAAFIRSHPPSRRAVS